MRPLHVVTLVAAALLAPVAFANAATYVVDRSHPQASDGNPGTETLPWLTIQHAADTVTAGDTVYVKAGTYPEQVVVTAAGAPGQEIVLAAWPGHTVTLDGATVALPEWVGLLFVSGSSHVRITGFGVVNTGPYGTSTGIQVEDCSHVVVEGNRTSNTASSGILVWSSSDVLVDGNEVSNPMTLAADSRNECITVGRSTRVEVRSNHVHDNPNGRGEGICLKDGSSFVTAHHNHVHDVPSVGIYVDAHAVHTHDVEVSANRVHDVDGNGIAIASEQGGLLERVRVVNNLSYHNRYLGLEISSCCPDNGVVDHPMASLEIVNNSLWGNGWQNWGGGLGNGNTQVDGMVIRNNAVAGNLSFEIAMEEIDPSPWTVDHNLVDGWDGYPGELCGADCQIGDPLWIDPSNGDFHLQAGSPAVDTGSAALAPAEDFDGVARPQGAGVDIGALELPQGSTCTLTCSASAPATAEVGRAVAFAGTAVAAGCSGSPAWDWGFGDGSAHASAEDPTHTYQSAGTFTWTMTVSVDGAVCSDSGQVTVSNPPEPEVLYLVPGVAHLPGAGGSIWRTDLAVVNPGTADAVIALTFVDHDTGAETTVGRTLAAGASEEWVDIVAGALALQGSVKGLLQVGSSVPLAISCRTYNQETATRTFGQNLPALTADDALAGGEEGIVPHLKRSSRFRTNLGVVNLGSESATVAVELFDAEGRQVGRAGTLTVAGGAWKQQTDVLGWVGAGDREIAYARVTAAPAATRVWVYASLVDNSTGDPTTVTVVVPQL